MNIEDLEIRESGQEVVEYLREHHYSGTCSPISNSWGLYYGEELVGGINFSNPISEQVRKFVAGPEKKHQVTELSRLHTDDRCGKNVESWFVSKALKLLKKKKPKYRFVISYADTREGHLGIIYQATNAIYVGPTDTAHDFYEAEDGSRRSERYMAQNITREEAERRGWKLVEGKTKHRYIFPLPDPYESRRDVIEEIEPQQQPYPKHL